MQKPVVVPPPFIPYGWDLNRFASLIGSKTAALERARPETGYFVPLKRRVHRLAPGCLWENQRRRSQHVCRSLIVGGVPILSPSWPFCFLAYEDYSIADGKGQSQFDAIDLHP